MEVLVIADSTIEIKYDRLQYGTVLEVLFQFT